MKTKYFLLTLLLISFTQSELYAQSDKQKEITMPIYKLFEGMEKNDSSMVRKVMTNDITFYTFGQNEIGDNVLKSGDVQQFLNTIGSPKEVVFRELISNVKVQSDGDFASVWCDYSFYLGDKFHHCGIDQFLLINTDSGWKIRQIVDTRRTEGCE
ncbi:MAG: nuclear transport factor 2 family protein [Bacteroidota bacterium]